MIKGERQTEREAYYSSTQGCKPRPLLLPPPPPASQCPRTPPTPSPTQNNSFTLTDGAKFGGDYLAYPGDPFVYHAQFVVRVLPPSVGPAAQQAAGGSGDAPPPPPSPSLLPPGAIRPTLLKAWARGVHGARKHLLLATAADARELLQASPPRLRYLTIAKESGFVSSAAEKGPEGGEGTAGEAAAPAGGGGRGGGRGGRGGRHQQRGRGRGGRGSFARGRGGRGRDRGR